MIKNLSQLKKALNVGTKFKIVDHWRKDWVGIVRVVTKKQTNAIYSGVDGDPDHKISKANGGLGCYLPFGKASEWTFENGVATWRGGVQGDLFYSIQPI